jgi:hypothetical protein
MPFSHVNIADQPACLNGLTDIEEMLIARIKPVMHVRYTTGRQLSYKDHIINLLGSHLLKVSSLVYKLP